MIIGIGIDVVDVPRFEQTLHRTPAMRARLFTAPERDLPLLSLAARFAAKEALAKALGAPPGLVWTDVTVHRGDHGRPRLEVRGGVAELAARLGVISWHVSLSHDGGVATAVVVAEGSDALPAPLEDR
jgi:holo-[acyl-carrier protein] synthase